MSTKFKLIALLLLALAAVFYLFFDLTKHKPALSTVAPFTTDPYDAIGSFGVEAAGVLAMLSLIRAFHPYRQDVLTAGHKILFARTGLLLCLSVIITMFGNGIALARHPTLWSGKPAGTWLVLMVLGLTLLALWLGFVLMRSVSSMVNSKVFIRAAVISLVCLIAQALYPESLTKAFYGLLLTVIFGVLVLFIPIALLSSALVPISADEPVIHIRWVPTLLTRIGSQVALVVLTGLLAGAALVYMEFQVEGGSINTSRSFLVLGVYMGLETAGVLIGFLLLRKPLGLIFTK